MSQREPPWVEGKLVDEPSVSDAPPTIITGVNATGTPSARRESKDSLVTATPTARGLDDLPVVDIVDILLWAMIRKRATLLSIEPLSDTHPILLQQGTRSWTPSLLPAGLGDAVVARVALIAGLEIGAPGEQLGRIKVRAGGALHELMVMLRASPDGLGVVVRRIATVDDVAGRGVGAGDAVTDRIGIYTILGEIGRGAMGIVYRAEHGQLHKPVAIKVMHPHLASIPAVATRFVHEGLAASRARHPSIIDVTDAGTLGDGRPFLVMELVDGQTLDAMLRDGPVAPSRAVGIGRQIADALAAAHASGVIHRDLKPANIFLLKEDHVKIGDFGVAKVVGGIEGSPSVTQPGAVMGTPHYMSPEQARALPVDFRTDLYALGCVIFEMLTGHVPFDAESPVDVLVRHMTAPIPPVQSPFGPLPAILEGIVLRAMAKRVEERYQTAAEMSADIGRAAVALGRPGWRRWLPT